MTTVEDYTEIFGEFVVPGHEPRVKSYVRDIAELADNPELMLEEVHLYLKPLAAINKELSENFLEGMGKIMEAAGSAYATPSKVYQSVSEIAEKSVPMARYTIDSAARETIKGRANGLIPRLALSNYLVAMRNYVKWGKHENPTLGSGRYLGTLAGPTHRGG
jgi:hypothetical protein